MPDSRTDSKFDDGYEEVEKSAEDKWYILWLRPIITLFINLITDELQRFIVKQ